jgi:uncharacterized protein YutE (UPF0331/DUF86 family)
MARDVLLRKLAYLRQLLRDLTPFAQMSRDEIEKQHYTVERILELLVGAAADLTFHILAERGLTPTLDFINVYFDFQHTFCVSIAFGSCVARNTFP